MEQFSEFLPVFGFILSVGLFGYGLKKIFLKVEKDTTSNQKNQQKILKVSKSISSYFLKIYIYIYICK